jgi:hypothetical protein
MAWRPRSTALLALLLGFDWRGTTSIERWAAGDVRHLVCQFLAGVYVPQSFVVPRALCLQRGSFPMVLGPHAGPPDLGGLGVLGLTGGSHNQRVLPDGLAAFLAAVRIAGDYWHAFSEETRPLRSAGWRGRMCCSRWWTLAGAASDADHQENRLRELFQFWLWEHWFWNSPAFFKVCFSAEHGLFTWTPILIPAVSDCSLFGATAGCWGLARWRFSLLYLYLIGCYQDWDGISSFGNRFFVSLTPIFVLGLAATLQAAGQAFHERRGVCRGLAAVSFSSCGIWRSCFSGVCTWFLRADRFPGERWPTIKWLLFRRLPRTRCGILFSGGTP